MFGEEANTKNWFKFLRVLSNRKTETPPSDGSEADLTGRRLAITQPTGLFFNSILHERYTAFGEPDAPPRWRFASSGGRVE